ncbi:MAG TPA: crosslink repair DNA glycosylase YcaQ family protein [Anaerolineales bacterium]|nr:crosslink repair DNA glycosylase YcaQ family protein [Anaerolineales bacterium]
MRILSISTARRFLLAHHFLYPPHSLQGKAGILQALEHLQNIQFDPIDVVGRNAELVLQSRVADFQPKWLNELLYQERVLWDGWDKMQGIYLTRDWAHFTRQRQAMHRHAEQSFMQTAPGILQAIAERGALSSLDFEGKREVTWFWGAQKEARAALDVLYNMGKIGVSHRVASRRYFQLIEKLLPAELLAQSDPHPTLEAYQDWHVLRRVGSLGLTDASSGEYWYGIQGTKSAERRATIARLLAQGKLLAVQVAGLPKLTLYLRAQDEPTLVQAENASPAPVQAAFIAPLDNLIWNRNLIAQLFGFEYKWEVYTPAEKRRYGYYVLPVLAGERFVARADFRFDKKQRNLQLNGWWWERDVQADGTLRQAVEVALAKFAHYLGAEPPAFSA